MTHSVSEQHDPVWRRLGGQEGVQEPAYADAPRAEIYRFFGHEPLRVLDVGCATGAVGAGLKQRNPNTWVWGCELNEHTAGLAAQRLDRVTTKPMRKWGKADVARLRTVDTVLLMDVLEHMYNPWGELEFLSRHLGANAQVIVSLPNVAHIAIQAGLAQGEFRYESMGILDVTHIRFFTLGGMRAMFEETGFRIAASDILNITASTPPSSFPLHATAGAFSLRIDNLEDWRRLHAIQFGFRLAVNEARDVSGRHSSP